MRDKAREQQGRKATWTVKVLRDFKPTFPGGLAQDIERERQRVLSELIIQPKVKPAR